MISLQRQLQRNMLVTLLAAIAALLLLVNAGVERLEHEYVLSRLQHDAESLIAALARNSDGQWALDAHRVVPQPLALGSSDRNRIPDARPNAGCVG
jgi:hypothetical protein